MKFIFHGAAKEVGRSCIELTGRKSRVLIDAGIKLSEVGTEFPVGLEDQKKLKGIDAVFISHAHLDHTGFLPLLDNRGLKCPIFATEETKEITGLLLKDAFKIGRLKHEHLGYEKADIEKALAWIKNIKIDKEGNIKGINFEYFDAGHIPGSASMIIEIDKKRIFYTGDINTKDTRLLKGAETGNIKDIDIMICESTYGDRDHPARNDEERRFVEEIKSTIENKGSVIIPVFAVGRAQEVALIINGLLGEFINEDNVPIYLDGMAIDATKIIQKYPYSIKSGAELAKSLENIEFVKGEIQRENIIRKSKQVPSIFITTSGMMTGGPVMDYMKSLYNNSKNSVLLTGFQGEHTNGRMLIEEGNIFIDGWRTKVMCNVKRFDFSAHAGQEELRNLVKKANPIHIIFVHGDGGPVDEMQKWARENGFNSYNPNLNEKIEV
ncbi:MAG: MBL fold metallo-hydrolase [Candidatus Woesearchaeota archaeon]|nr:MBL fold metallo-hydrolase [Candidatus Woesearchaeota archaeon]